MKRNCCEKTFRKLRALAWKHCTSTHRDRARDAFNDGLRWANGRMVACRMSMPEIESVSASLFLRVIYIFALFLREIAIAVAACRCCALISRSHLTTREMDLSLGDATRCDGKRINSIRRMLGTGRSVCNIKQDLSFDAKMQQNISN